MARSKGGLAAWAVGAATVGIGAGIALERALVGRRRRTEPQAEIPYGTLLPDRRYEVSSFDGAVLAADEFGPEDATSGAIFLHGFVLDRTIWHHQMEELDGTRKYVYYDAREHGNSRGGKARRDTKTLAKDLKAVLERSGLKETVLVGHSLGGMTALEFCREHPEEMGTRVCGLVLANTTYTDAVKTLFAAGIVVPVERRIRRTVERLLSDPVSSRALRLRGDDLSWMLVKLFGFGPGVSTAQVEYVQRLLNSFPSPGLVEVLQGLREFDMEEALHTISVPTLIIAGGDDRITTVRASKKMAEEIPESELFVFPRAGHMTMMEQPEKFNALMRSFIERTLPSK